MRGRGDWESVTTLAICLGCTAPTLTAGDWGISQWGSYLGLAGHGSFLFKLGQKSNRMGDNPRGHCCEVLRPPLTAFLLPAP